MVKQQHRLLVALLGLWDCFVISVACYAAWAIRRLTCEGYFPALPEFWESYFKNPLVAFVVPITIVVMRANGLYRARRDRSVWSEQGAILRASMLSMLLVVVVLWLVGNAVITDGSTRALHLDAGRTQLGWLAVLLPVFLGINRLAFRTFLRMLRRRGWNLRHAAVIGVGRLGQITVRTLERNSWTGINVAYFISHRPRARRDTCLERPVLGGLDDLEATLERHPVDAVYLAIPNAQASCVPDILRRLERFAVDVRIIPDVQPRYLPQSMTVSELDGMPILSYRECPLHGLGGLTKRAVDILGSSIGLLVFSPVMLACAIAVRLSGPGPIIFKQRRVSIGGETFKIYKFRTMYQVEDEQRPADARWTERNDPRITPVGRLLRRASLDELPQLLNVLKGQMSLVGPRPERPELIERFREDWRGYMIRQHVKAGMTGWAQVNGLRGDTSLKKRLQYDLHYIRHWSVWFDLKILWLTLFRGFVHRNAH
ncbi:MAG: hypothetical protein AMXMBFR77_06140 [Phycisphaerales bacterium]|nr:undecaprenyl-phosphate glucose phosphotransferase [Phycisphaerales bacterium]GIK19896.1 MAG: undecaprenyl-phosphate glucose phosphotransferase [Planctomycetota bacterium]